MPLTLKVADRGQYPDLPEPDQKNVVALYWRGETKAKVPVGQKGRRRTQKIKVWISHAFVFGALRKDHEGRPPEAPELERHMVLQAYALAACHYPIPSDAEVLYEVRT